jgi:hypothetical protein
MILLQYHQLDTPKNDITNECRALILDSNFNVVCKSFTRFDDYNPNVKTSFDFSNAKYTEKIDGTLINMWFYDSKWNISTKSMIYNPNYDESFWNTWNEYGYILPEDTTKTYIFEFKFPSDRQFLTKCEKSTITLIGISDNITFEDIEVKPMYNLSIVEQYNFTLPELLKKCYELNPMISEGFVIRDSNGNRLKVKSPQWNAISLLSDDSKNNTRRLHDIVRWNSHNEFLFDYEEHRGEYNQIYSKFISEKEKIFNLFELLKDKDKRTIGIYLKDNNMLKYTGVIFSLYDKKVDNINDLFYNVTLNNFIDFMK